VRVLLRRPNVCTRRLNDFTTSPHGNGGRGRAAEAALDPDWPRPLRGYARPRPARASARLRPAAEDLGRPHVQLMVLGRGEFLAALFAALLGAMSIPAEIRHGTIRSTFLVTPAPRSRRRGQGPREHPGRSGASDSWPELWRRRLARRRSEHAESTCCSAGATACSLSYQSDQSDTNSECKSLGELSPSLSRWLSRWLR
jgi:hypothetical protein